MLAYVKFCILFLLVFAFVQTSFCIHETLASDITSNTKTRNTRKVDTTYLAFPQGSNVQLVYCMTIGTYTKPQGIFTVGVTAGLAWELPDRNTVLYSKQAEVYHRRSRRELYRKLEIMLKTHGTDGRACILKAICKAANRSSEKIAKGTFLEEILHSIFTLPEGYYELDPMTEYEKVYRTGENCQQAETKCPDLFI